MRGEAGRVAARVRELLGDYDDAATDVEPRAVAGAPTRPSLAQRLSARVPIRLDPGRRGAMAVGVAVVVAAVATGLWILAQRPRAMSVADQTSPIPGAMSPVGTASAAVMPPGPMTAAVPAGSAAPPVGASSASSLLVVDVAGKVRHPGLYRLPPGSRVDDALRAAGGPRHGVNLTSLNLAAMVVDGQQILVGIPGGAPAAPNAAGTSSAAASPSGLVDLNTATLDQLEALPGVGPVTAQYILDWRAAHGRFTSVDQLDDVTGIGPAKLADLRPLVTV